MSYERKGYCDNCKAMKKLKATSSRIVNQVIFGIQIDYPQSICNCIDCGEQCLDLSDEIEVIIDLIVNHPIPNYEYTFNGTTYILKIYFSKEHNLIGKFKLKNETYKIVDLSIENLIDRFKCIIKGNMVLKE